MKIVIVTLLFVACSTTLRSETVWIQEEKRICDQIVTATRVLEFDGTEYTHLGGNIDPSIDCLSTTSTTHEIIEEIKPAEFPNPPVFKTHSITQTNSWTVDDYIVDVTDIDIVLTGGHWFLNLKSQESASGEIDTIFTRTDGTVFTLDTQLQMHNVNHASRWKLDGTGNILKIPKDSLWEEVVFMTHIPSDSEVAENQVFVPDSSVPSGEWGLITNRVRVPFAVVGPLLDVLPPPDRIIRYNVPEPQSLLALLLSSLAALLTTRRPANL